MHTFIEFSLYLYFLVSLGFHRFLCVLMHFNVECVLVLNLLIFGFCFAEALKLVISECKPKAKIVDICEKGDSFIRE